MLQAYIDENETILSLQQKPIELSSLTFAPVISTARSGVTKQQFGLSPFSFTFQEEQFEVIIAFEEPFVDNRYVLTATIDHPACYAVIHSKTAEQAKITVIRTRISHDPKGEINWIAIGRA
ncbi:WIAG-tail domain [Paenibacillus sp. Soil522]|uniref:WIAG-tail domain n=1 Tax=Paenibacillus sp. Soil522 TaxID=1736388 RepID=UPI003FA6B02F